LWCIDRKSDRFAAFSKAGRYTISLLGTAHEAVSVRLARQGAHDLADIDLIETRLGPPALADALAFFECEREAIHDGGDHAILVGRVVRFTKRDKGAPLIFHKGRYGSLASYS
jgi:flavin reductase (DIM6/NTAB) family NADH-FMN oxidoreductase RutF